MSPDRFGRPLLRLYCVASPSDADRPGFTMINAGEGSISVKMPVFGGRSKYSLPHRHQWYWQHRCPSNQRIPTHETPQFTRSNNSIVRRALKRLLAGWDSAVPSFLGAGGKRAGNQRDRPSIDLDSPARRTEAQRDNSWLLAAGQRGCETTGEKRGRTGVKTRPVDQEDV